MVSPFVHLILTDIVNKSKKKLKSGILDKASASIEHKEIWPQKNLLEEYADAEISFRQMQYEHYVAGECRTIETCKDSEEMMGRARVMRRIAYLKLRGNEWSSIRTMYTAILRSKEIGENSWPANFEMFENIVSRRVPKDKEKDRDTNRTNDRFRRGEK